ncbi:hypothetical protein BKA62DRAFT_48382 [Auriculariales sp. MPI-PUGE-AT-0066]|nr:hypothetical protein BKA62DRAFT_48382 [Auriculariales sp. MPI-PUGE-AT-0066]
MSLRSGLAALLVATLALATPTPVDKTASLVARADTFVTDISKCPKLTKRTPTSVHDLRPDDFSVVMAVGDSITAGCFANGLQSTDPLSSLDEWRGISYAGGGDSGRVTIPNLLKYYTGSVTGASTGHHGIELCFGPLCVPGSLGYDPDVDQLNAALSGSLASNLLHQAVDYLVPMVKALNVSSSAFKYLNLQIGSNDLCQMCLAAVSPTSADLYELSVRLALEYVRVNVPNVVVNVVANIPVSQVYDLTLNEPYCTKILPVHYNIECTCALLGGAAGEATRALMVSLQKQYDARLLKIVQDYQKANYAGFAAIYQPLNIPLADWPVESLSDVDCFHPSAATHARVAAEAWNRLSLNATGRAAGFVYSDTVQIRCLQESDRILTKANI